MNITEEIVKKYLNSDENKFGVYADDLSSSIYGPTQNMYFRVKTWNRITGKKRTMFFPYNITLKDFIQQIEKLKQREAF